MKPDTPMHAIRLKCLECCCGQTGEVRLCHIKDCALWAYRFGHRPNKAPAAASSNDIGAEQAAGVKDTAEDLKDENSAPTHAFMGNEQGVDTL